MFYPDYFQTIAEPVYQVQQFRDRAVQTWQEVQPRLIDAGVMVLEFALLAMVATYDAGVTAGKIYRRLKFAVETAALAWRHYREVEFEPIDFTAWVKEPLTEREREMVETAIVEQAPATVDYVVYCNDAASVTPVSTQVGAHQLTPVIFATEELALEDADYRQRRFGSDVIGFGAACLLVDPRSYRFPIGGPEWERPVCDSQPKRRGRPKGSKNRPK